MGMMRGEEVMHDHGRFGTANIRFSIAFPQTKKVQYSKYLVFLRVPVVCCTSKMKQGSAEEKGGASLLKSLDECVYRGCMYNVK
jgi:hypothetical protein